MGNIIDTFAWTRVESLCTQAIAQGRESARLTAMEVLELKRLGIHIEVDGGGFSPTYGDVLEGIEEARRK